MEKVINLGIPHIGEHIFKSIDTQQLLKYLEVSETWKVLAENVLIKRWKGKIFEACQNGETKVVQLLLENFTCEENGLNNKDTSRRPLIVVVCIRGLYDIVKLLLHHSYGNIDLNARDRSGWTAFMSACLNGHKNVVELLLNHSDPNFDLNAQDDFGMTAFAKACYKGHKDVVQLFLDHTHKIELNTKNHHGMTAFTFACNKGHKEVVQLLLDHSDKIELNAEDYRCLTEMFDLIQTIQDIGNKLIQ